MGQERQPHWFQTMRITCAATLLTIVPACGWARPTATPQVPGAQTQTGDAGIKAAFEDFLGRVNAYIKLRSSLEATLPKLKPTDQPDKLADHEKSLSAKILDARKNARQGDIFTKEISAQFLQQIREEFRGPQGHEARQTIRQGEPVDLPVHVNQVYPRALPHTTVPPTLLLKLPKLPQGIEYRIIGRAFVVYDVRARMVIDFIPGALPAPAHAA